MGKASRSSSYAGAVSHFEHLLRSNKNGLLHLYWKQNLTAFGGFPWPVYSSFWRPQTWAMFLIASCRRKGATRLARNASSFKADSRLRAKISVSLSLISSGSGCLRLNLKRKLYAGPLLWLRVFGKGKRSYYEFWKRKKRLLRDFITSFIKLYGKYRHCSLPKVPAFSWFSWFV